MRRDASTGRIFAASILAAVAALEMGAAAVTAETELSGITALPAGRFLLFMMPIHLAIGLCEGVATAAVLCVVRRYRPELLADAAGTEAEKRRSLAGAAAVIALAALLTGGVSHIASSDPTDWSGLSNGLRERPNPPTRPTDLCTAQRPPSPNARPSCPTTTPRRRGDRQRRDHRRGVGRLGPHADSAAGSMKERLQRVLCALDDLERASQRPSPLQRMDARSKTAAATLFLVTMLSVPLAQLSELLLYALFPIAAAAAGGIDYGAVCRRSLIALPFAAMIGLFNPICLRDTVFSIGA